MNLSLENDIALVTGASRGIGRAISDALGQAGSVVVGTATTEGGAEAITARFQQQGISGQGMVLNVTDADACASVVDAVGKSWSPVTVLVNNAGITRDNLMLRMKDEEWDDVLATNLTAVYRMSRLCLRGMLKAKRGRVINIASVVGSTGNPGQANYAAAKAGLEGFGRSMAREVGSRGITVNTIAPGFIESDMTESLPEAQKEALTGQIVLGRLGQPAEIGAAAVFLASSAADYITGQTLHVNGGMYMS